MAHVFRVIAWCKCRCQTPTPQYHIYVIFHRTSRADVRWI